MNSSIPKNILDACIVTRNPFGELELVSSLPLDHPRAYNDGIFSIIRAESLKRLSLKSGIPYPTLKLMLIENDDSFFPVA
jgi:hypothetical protein